MLLPGERSGNSNRHAQFQLWNCLAGDLFSATGQRRTIQERRKLHKDWAPDLLQELKRLTFGFSSPRRSIQRHDDALLGIIHSAIQLDLRTSRLKARFTFHFPDLIGTVYSAESQETPAPENDPTAERIRLILFPALLRHGSYSGRGLDRRTEVASAVITCTPPPPLPASDAHGQSQGDSRPLSPSHATRATPSSRHSSSDSTSQSSDESAFGPHYGYLFFRGMAEMVSRIRRRQEEIKPGQFSSELVSDGPTHP